MNTLYFDLIYGQNLERFQITGTYFKRSVRQIFLKLIQEKLMKNLCKIDIQSL